jgi:hypothetical protein
MQLIKKDTSKSATVKRAENKTIIVTKSKTTSDSPFAKKIKKMNTLLGKAKLLS